ncbi:flagellar hook-length control protein FliK [bacterium]|nr:flagellar hook-length control protein FliK [bacterium]
MMDAIVAIAPQSIGTENKVEQGNDVSKDGSEFSDVLGTAIKDEQQSQVKDSDQAEDQATMCSDDTQTDTQPERQEDDMKTDSSDLQAPVQMLAFFNVQIPQEIQQTGANAVDTITTEDVSDIKDSVSVSSQPLTSDSDAVEMAAAQNLSEFNILDDVSQLTAEPLDAIMDVGKTGNTGNSTTARPMSVEGTTKTVRTIQAGSISVDPDQSVESVELLSSDVTKSNKTVWDQKTTLDTSIQTKIEVTASTDPPREFTIKPQVMSPVSNQSDNAATLISDAVSQVASTDNSGINADTSGSQNSQAAIFSVQTSADAAVRQTVQTQPAQTAQSAREPVHTQIIDQIVRDVKLIKLPQQSDLVVRLSPPELGSLRVQITQADQGMTAQIQTTGDQVRGLLQAHLPALNQAFSDAGLKMDSVTVTSGTQFGSLMQDSMDGNTQQQWGGQKQHYAGSQDASLNQPVATLSTGIADRDGTIYNWLA